MTTRLDLVFSGSPDDEESNPVLQEVIAADGATLPSLFIRWRRLTSKADTWAMTVDALAFDRPKIVYIVATREVTDDDLRAAVFDLTASNTVPIALYGDRELDEDRRLKLQKSCIDICDRVFVINIGDIDDATASIIKRAEDTGRPVVYLRY